MNKEKTENKDQIKDNKPTVKKSTYSKKKRHQYRILVSFVSHL